MKDAKDHLKIDSRYILASAVAVIFSWLLHEFAHWITGNWLGYEMVMTLNSGYPSKGSYDVNSHHHIISAAGPVITVIEATIAFFLITQRNLKMLYPFLFTCFYMRLFATAISFLNPNDEARISDYLGWGKFTLPLIVTVFLFLLVYKISRRYSLTKKFNAISLALVIFFTSIIIMADQFLKVRIL